MEKQQAYVTLAKWFEYLNDDCGYENWSQYFIAKLRAYPVRVGLDVGCGGGWFTRAFARAGYQMTGMDISAEMLDTAQSQALKEGVRGEYLLGDITRKNCQSALISSRRLTIALTIFPRTSFPRRLKT